MKRSCPGCLQNTQQIKILENRILYLEQHMMTRSSTPYRKSRSKTRRSRSRPKDNENNTQGIKNNHHNEKVQKSNRFPSNQHRGKRSNQLDDLETNMERLRVSTLPEYQPQPPYPQQLDPVAPEFAPRGYYAYEGPGTDGGACGYY